MIALPPLPPEEPRNDLQKFLDEVRFHDRATRNGSRCVDANGWRHKQTVVVDRAGGAWFVASLPLKETH
jgi:hypothetical protein